MIDFLKKGNNLLYFGLLLLIIINLLQGYYTELLSDEAYYWVYRQYMNWGYFDHPPMVALWVWISNLFIKNGELSVRFFAAFTFSATVYGIWHLINHPKKRDFIGLFLLIVISTALFNVYGFITVPDTPLLFFMVLFLLGYKKYLEKQSLISYILLIFAITGMLYSKYQAVLIILFVLFSNLKVLKDYKIWLVILGVLALFSPHLYWQYINNFPSVKYHLFERNSHTNYKFEYTYMHFINAIAIIGFTFPIVYKAFFNNLKNTQPFQKALNYLIIGFFVFFFISSFRGHTQAQWIVPVSIPLIYITYYFLIAQKQHLKIFKILAFITILVSFLLRLFMANEWLPIQLEMHGNKAWVTNLEKKLNGKKPLFVNSYQNTSIYWFYSGKQPFQYNTYWSRKNQFELLEMNRNAIGTNLATVSGDKQTSNFTIKKRNTDSLYISYLTAYKSKTGILYTFKAQNPKLTQEALNRIEVQIKNPYNESVFIDSLTTKVCLYNAKKQLIKKLDFKTLIKNPLLKNTTNNKGFITFYLPKTDTISTVKYIQLIGKKHRKIYPYRISDLYEVLIK